MTNPAASSQTRFRSLLVDEVEVVYREAGPADAPVLLLLHGFPSSSHQYRDLIPLLADRYRVIAPDLPGFGSTRAPEGYTFTFERLARTIDGFTEQLELDRYALYVFDYGAPVGFRLATAHPERVTAIITQNGNAYAEGLEPSWAPLQAYWQEDTVENRDALRGLLTVDTTRFQYTHGVPDDRVDLVSPDAIASDQAILDRDPELQLDLFRDYGTNVDLYPVWQAYLRKHQPPVLAVWGKNDPFFGPAGADAFRRDVPEAEIYLLDAGHFALETHRLEIAERIRDFMPRALAVLPPSAVPTPP